MVKRPRQPKPVYFALTTYSAETRQQMLFKVYAAMSAMLSGAATGDHYTTLARAANTLWALVEGSVDPDIKRDADEGSDALKTCRERVKTKGMRYGLTGEEHRKVSKMLGLWEQVVLKASHAELASALAAAEAGFRQARRAGVSRLTR